MRIGWYMNSSCLSTKMPDMLELLFPLSRFYEEQGINIPEVCRVESDEVPQPYQSLLVHQNDMTPTLEKFHSGILELEVLRRKLDEDILAREVVLRVENVGKATEFGAIIIYLLNYPVAAREDIIAGHLPLGTILAKHLVQHESCPQAFIRILSDPTINSALGISVGQVWLYGRRNRLTTPAGEILADILEILPPV